MMYPYLNLSRLVSITTEHLLWYSANTLYVEETKEPGNMQDYILNNYCKVIANIYKNADQKQATAR